ncbi:MAG: 4Fe-4S dicluster domain-containing protein [Planctomycetes bacterium]|nr:4Fe-4S dicluster domain-containing protein [Planctomycetota bacterium]
MPEEIDNQPHDRRSMFRMGFRKLMEPVANYIQERIEISLPVLREVLRPPGALPEKQFLETCYRCGNCVDVCPAKAIRPLTGGDVDQTGTPYIDPDLAACVVCDELACMKSCPSGALRLIADPSQIRMGLAVVDHGLCVRSRGADCTLCVDKCPLGPHAIRLDGEGRVAVLAAGCVGCGACQFYCPTTPRAIVVHPA